MINATIASTSLARSGRPRTAGAALVMPHADTWAMSKHLAEISSQVAPGAHAIVIIDGAGWHTTKSLIVPDNISLMRLPAYSPELNPQENIPEDAGANMRFQAFRNRGAFARRLVMAGKGAPIHALPILASPGPAPPAPRPSTWIPASSFFRRNQRVREKRLKVMTTTGDRPKSFPADQAV